MREPNPTDGMTGPQAAVFTAKLRAAYAPDRALATDLLHALGTLSAHDPAYGRVIGQGPGPRLASMFRAGMVATATPAGREAMAVAYVHAAVACTLEPGLDTNTLMDRVTGRPNPRRQHLDALRLARADREDRIAIAARAS